MSAPALVEVAAALIRDGAGRYLLTRRRLGTHLAGLWEFPGGKREPPETIEACLRRELTEELAARFSVGECVETVRWQYPEKTVILHFHRCRLESGTIIPQEAQEMAWVEPERLDEYELPPADRALIERLRRESSEGAPHGRASGATAPCEPPPGQDCAGKAGARKAVSPTPC